MIENNFFNIHTQVNLSSTVNEECFLQCFPREYRQYTQSRNDWMILYKEYSQASEYGLDDNVKLLFSKVRSQHHPQHQLLDEQDIEMIYNSLGVKDNLGYELLEMCNQTVLDKVYEKYSYPVENSSDNLLLAVLCNKDKEIAKSLEQLLIKYTPATQQCREVINNLNLNNVKNIESILTDLISRHMVKITINNFTNAQGVLGGRHVPPNSVFNCWHTDGAGNILQNLLQLAVKFNRTEILKILLRAGALIDIDGLHREANPAIFPPQTLTVAAIYGHADMLDILQQNRAKLSGSVLSMWSALSYFENETRNDAMDTALSNGEWNFCEQLISCFPDIQHRFKDLLPKIHSKCINIVNKENNTQILHDPVKTFCNQILKSNLAMQDKLMIYTKTFAMLKKIHQPDLSRYIKKSIITDFQANIAVLIPSSSPIAKAVSTLVIAAAGFVLGAVATSFLVGLSLPAGVLTGTICAGSAAFFSHKALHNRDYPQALCEAARTIAHT